MISTSRSGSTKYTELHFQSKETEKLMSRWQLWQRLRWFQVTSHIPHSSIARCIFDLYFKNSLTSTNLWFVSHCWLLVWCSLRPAHFLEELSQNRCHRVVANPNTLVSTATTTPVVKVPSDYFMKLKKSYAFDFVGLWKVHRHMLHARVT